MAAVRVRSPCVQYSDDTIESSYSYQTTSVSTDNNELSVTPIEHKMTLQTQRKVGRVGAMLVGWGGNNGSTVTGVVLANRLGLKWPTKTGIKEANYYGSIVESSTVSMGFNEEGQEVFALMKSVLPLLDPNDIQFDGWDLSSADLATAMERAGVFDVALQTQLKPHMAHLVPRKTLYCPDFVAANQSSRADHVLKGTKSQALEQIRSDIRDFKKTKQLDKVIVMWTANTERFCEVAEGLNDSEDALLASIKANRDEVSPSTVFAVASILEGCTYINGSPQNTFVPGVVQLAERKGVTIAGDDFKTGQTKLKCVLVDFLVSAGMKPTSIVSYNHLGNNDGLNLSAQPQFRSKEVSKSSVVDDMVQSNPLLYRPGEGPDHVVVIKYTPSLGDSKRAMDEYVSEICMGGVNTIAIHNTCEDSLLAAPIVLDLLILADLFSRIQVKTDPGRGQAAGQYEPFHPVLSALGYLLKAPLVPRGAPVVNALFKQRACIENIFRACIGLAPQHHMQLEHRIPTLISNLRTGSPKSPISNGTIKSGRSA